MTALTREPVRIAIRTHAEFRTVPRGTRLFIAVVGFLGLWGNRGLIFAVSNTASNVGMWLVMWLWRVTTFVYWRVSRKASEELKAKRNRDCNECDSLERDGNKRFCGSCGCPRTKSSELTTKNGREGHNCPLGIHPGSVRLAKRPCSGGGCGKKKNKAIADYAI